MQAKTLPDCVLHDLLAHERRPMRDRHLEGVIAARAAADFALELAHPGRPVPGFEDRFLEDDPA